MSALSEESLGVRIVLIAIALVFFGVGSALDIAAAMGAGLRYPLMLITARRLEVRIGVARTGIEVAVLVLGFVLGGTVGIGTVVFGVGTAAVEASFWVLARTPLAGPG